jgi:hypothetical protein
MGIEDYVGIIYLYIHGMQEGFKQGEENKRITKQHRTTANSGKQRTRATKYNKKNIKQ